MPKQHKAIRHAVSLVARLCAGETLTVAEVAAEGVFREAACRDHLDLLAELLPNVHKTPHRPARYAWRTPTEVTGDPDHTAAAIAVARTFFAGLRDSWLDMCLSDLLEAHLQAHPHASEPGRTERLFFSRTRSGGHLDLNADVVDRLLGALIGGRRLRFSYRGFDGHHDEVELEPFTLVFGEDGLYAYGRVTDSGREDRIDRRRLFRVARMTDLTTGQRFAYPPADAYDPRRDFEHCFGIFLPADDARAPSALTLVFGAHWRAYLQQHRLHASQRSRALADGRTEVELALHETTDLIQWLRGLGAEVDILAPATLRAAVSAR